MRKGPFAWRSATASRTPGAAISPTRPGRRRSSSTPSGSYRSRNRPERPTIRYSDWQAAGPGKWVPGRIDVQGGSSHYRMNFAWLGDAVWLLRDSESIAPEATVPLTRTRNVVVNGRQVTAPVTADEKARKRQRACGRATCSITTARGLTAGRPVSAGSRRSRHLSYTFHTVREDVRETATVDRGGEVVVEVAHDGQGKMKGPARGPGDRAEHARIRLVTAGCTVRADSWPLRARAGSTLRPGLEALRPDRLPARPARSFGIASCSIPPGSPSRKGPGRAGLARWRP